jgi:hypothetical protein
METAQEPHATVSTERLIGDKSPLHSKCLSRGFFTSPFALIL